jgi:hypothetical protein
MKRAAASKKAAPDPVQWDKATLKRAGLSAEQGAELAQRLSDVMEKRQADELARAWDETQQMLAIWSPHYSAVLDKLRKKSVDVDGLRRLIEQISRVCEC